MRLKTIRMTLGLLALGLALPAHAQMPMPARDAACPAIPASPPPELKGWAQRQPLTAGTRKGGDDTPLLMIGQAADVSLRPAETVFFANPLVKAVAPGDQGGLIAFRVGLTGTYRVALGAGAWVDVVRSGKLLTSIAHGHGPACTGIRKTVDFDLAPGDYLLQLSAAHAPTVAVLIVHLP
jgi:hypothetical protein